MPTPRLSRRAALAGLGVAAAGAALAATGCTSKPSPPPADLLATDSLGPLYRETEELIRQYDAALAGTPSLAAVLGPLREEHRQHLTALASLIGLPTPTISAGPNASGIPFPLPSGVAGSSPQPPNPAQSGLPAEGDNDSSAPGSEPANPAAAAAVRASLSAAEKTAATNAVDACIAAKTNRVAVLASIAACRATHVAALR